SGEPLTAVRVEDLGSQSEVRFKDHERLRYLAKTLVRTGNNGSFQHSRMCVDDPLHFKAGNIFSAGNNDVLHAVLDFDITIGMKHGEIVCMEPSSSECLLSCLRIPVVTFHDGVSADNDLADFLTVWLNVAHAFADYALLYHQVGHALACLQYHSVWLG